MIAAEDGESLANKKEGTVKVEIVKETDSSFFQKDRCPIVVKTSIVGKTIFPASNHLIVEDGKITTGVDCIHRTVESLQKVIIQVSDVLFAFYKYIMSIQERLPAVFRAQGVEYELSVSPCKHIQTLRGE